MTDTSSINPTQHVHEERDAAFLDDHGYECIQFIGRGSFGTVYAAKNKAKDLILAVKVLESPKTALESRHLRNEIEMLVWARREKKTGLVRMFDFFAGGDLVGLVTELCYGGSLGGMLRSVGDRKEEVFFGLVRAVWEMHEGGFVHGDINPSNILLRKPLELGVDVCLCDCGFGGEYFFGGEGEEKEVFCGTEGYCAPEVVEMGRVSTASDMYAVGCVGKWLGLEEEGGPAIRVVVERLTSRRAEERPSASDVLGVLRGSTKKDIFSEVLEVNPKKDIFSEGLEVNPQKDIFSEGLEVNPPKDIFSEGLEVNTKKDVVGDIVKERFKSLEEERARERNLQRLERAKKSLEFDPDVMDVLASYTQTALPKPHAVSPRLQRRPVPIVDARGLPVLEERGRGFTVRILEDGGVQVVEDGGCGVWIESGGRRGKGMEDEEFVEVGCLRAKGRALVRLAYRIVAAVRARTVLSRLVDTDVTVRLYKDESCAMSVLNKWTVHLSEHSQITIMDSNHNKLLPSPISHEIDDTKSLSSIHQSEPTHQSFSEIDHDSPPSKPALPPSILRLFIAAIHDAKSRLLLLPPNSVERASPPLFSTRMLDHLRSLDHPTSEPIQDLPEEWSLPHSERAQVASVRRLQSALHISFNDEVHLCVSSTTTKVSGPHAAPAVEFANESLPTWIQTRVSKGQKAVENLLKE